MKNNRGVIDPASEGLTVYCFEKVSGGGFPESDIVKYSVKNCEEYSALWSNHECIEPWDYSKWLCSDENRMCSVDEQPWDYRNRFCSADEQPWDYENPICSVDEQPWDYRNQFCATDEQLWDYEKQVDFVDEKLNTSHLSGYSLLKQILIAVAVVICTLTVGGGVFLKYRKRRTEQLFENGETKSHDEDSRRSTSMGEQEMEEQTYDKKSQETDTGAGDFNMVAGDSVDDRSQSSQNSDQDGLSTLLPSSPHSSRRVIDHSDNLPEKEMPEGRENTNTTVSGEDSILGSNPNPPAKASLGDGSATSEDPTGASSSAVAPLPTSAGQMTATPGGGNAKLPTGLLNAPISISLSHGMAATNRSESSETSSVSVEPSTTAAFDVKMAEIRASRIKRFLNQP